MRNAPRAADVATPLLAWLTTREQIVQAHGATQSHIDKMQSARNAVRAEIERASAIRSDEHRNSSEATVARVVHSRMTIRKNVHENLRFLLGEHIWQGSAASGTNHGAGQGCRQDFITTKRFSFCLACGDEREPAGVMERTCVQELTAHEAGTHPLQSFQCLLDGSPLDAARVCPRCGASAEQLRHASRTQLGHPDDQRPPLLAVSFDGAVTLDDNNYLVRFDDISRDTYELHLPNAAASRDYRLVAMIMYNGSHYVADVRGDGAGGPVLGTNTWVRLDGMAKPYPVARPVPPPTGAVSNGYWPMCGIFCELERAPPPMHV